MTTEKAMWEHIKNEGGKCPIFSHKMQINFPMAHGYELWILNDKW